MKLSARGVQWALSAVLACLYLLAVACGDDDGEGVGGPTAAPTAAVASPAGVFSCSEEPASTEPDRSAFPLTVADDSGREIRLEGPPAAIASLSAAHTEILYAIGAGDQVVAADSFSDCPLAAAALPHLDSFSPSVESIVALEPDLVIIFFDPGGLVDSLTSAGIPVTVLESPASIDGVYGQIELLGRATGHEEGAAGLVARMRTAIDSITVGLADVQPGPRVFHEVDNTYFTAGPGSFIGHLYEILKARNIAEASGEPFPQLSAEAIIQADPEVIILADEDAGESPQTVAARPGWGDITAVKEGRVYVIDPDIVSRPGPRLPEALQTLAGFLYPKESE